MVMLCMWKGERVKFPGQPSNEHANLEYIYMNTISKVLFLIIYIIAFFIEANKMYCQLSKAYRVI